MDAPELLTAAHLQAVVRHIDASLDHLRTAMLEGCALVEARVVQVETRLTHIETRLDHLDMRLNQMDGRFLQLDSRLGRLAEREVSTPTMLAWLTAGVALVLSILALWR